MSIFIPLCEQYCCGAYTEYTSVDGAVELAGEEMGNGEVHQVEQQCITCHITCETFFDTYVHGSELMTSLLIFRSSTK